jgi:CIC family chloride channel protein
MAGFFAGVAKAPISSLVMVSEMTLGYGLLVPLMLTTAVAYLLTPRSITIYERQVEARADSPAHEGQFIIDVLERLSVKEAINRTDKLVVFRRDTPLGEILAAVAGTKQHLFPIVEDGALLRGVIDFHDIRVFLTEHAVQPHLLVADDLRAPEVRVVAIDEDLASALRKFYVTPLEELPVVESEDSRKLVGILSRRDVIAAYHHQMYRPK